MNYLPKGNLIQKKDEKNILNNLRSEFHFLKYPFFDLSPRHSKKDRIEIIEIKEDEKEKTETWWKIIRSLDNDLPSSFARKIHKEVVEKILNSIQKPVTRLIRLGSMRQICKMLNIAPSGENDKQIKKALDDIKTASIKVKRTFRKKEKDGTKKFFEGSFSLYDMVFFTGQTLPDGTKADAVYVLLNDMYIQNFNNNFVVPLDYQYVQSLKGEIASRMYEILNIWFYPALENRKECIQKKYSELCSYFPLVRRNKKHIAKGQLKKAHQQHVSSGFLAGEPTWIDTNKKDDWLIEYRIGLKAKKWYFENNKLGNISKEVKQLEELLLENQEKMKGKEREELKEKEKIDDTNSNQTKNNPLTQRLIEQGITASVAENLVENYKTELIEYWIIAANKKENIEDKSAFLVKAIKENWNLPVGIQEKKRETAHKREEELKTAYYEFIIPKVDECLKKMKKEDVEKELEKARNEYVNGYPKELRESFIEVYKKDKITPPQIKFYYKTKKIKEFGLLSFEEWRSQNN